MSLYWVRGGEFLGVSHRAVPGEPTATEGAAGLTSTVPAGSALLGLTVSQGVATADFNATFASGGGTFSVRARVAQVGYTLTQFPAVSRVQFKVAGVTATTFSAEGLLQGQPVGRSDGADLLPPIFVENPAVGDTVHSPLHLNGSSDTYEATFQVELVNAAGKTVVNRHVTATAGNGTRGTFSELIPYATTAHGAGRLTVYALSAADGSRTGQVVIPLAVDP